MVGGRFLVLYTFSALDNGAEPTGPCGRPSEAVTFLRRSVLSVRRALGGPDAVFILLVTETPSRLAPLLAPFDVTIWTYADAMRSLQAALPSTAEGIRVAVSKQATKKKAPDAAVDAGHFGSIGHCRVWMLPLLRHILPSTRLMYLDDDAGMESGALASNVLLYSGSPLAYEIQRGTSVRKTLAPHLHMSESDELGAYELVNNGAMLFPPTQESTDACMDVATRYCELCSKWGMLKYWDMIAVTSVWNARRLGTIRSSRLPVMHLYQNKYRPDLVDQMLSALGRWRAELDRELCAWYESKEDQVAAKKVREWSEAFFRTDWPRHLIASTGAPTHMERVNMSRLMRSRPSR